MERNKSMEAGYKSFLATVCVMLNESYARFGKQCEEITESLMAKHEGEYDDDSGDVTIKNIAILCDLSTLIKDFNEFMKQDIIALRK